MTSPEPSPPRRRSRGALGPTIFAALLCLISGYMAIEALSFPYRPRLAPLLFAGLTVAFGLVVFVAEAMDLRAMRRGRRRAEVPVGRSVEEGGTSASGQVSAAAVVEDPTTTGEAAHLGASAAGLERAEYAAFGYVAILVLSFYLLGFLIGMSVFMALVMRVYGRETWRLTLGVTVGVMAVMYVLFVQVLGVKVYAGRLGALLPLPF